MNTNTWILVIVIAITFLALGVVTTQQVQQFWVSRNSDASVNASDNLRNNVFRLNGYFRRKNNHRKVEANVTKLRRVGYGRAFNEAVTTIMLPVGESIPMSTNLAASGSTMLEPKENTKSVYVVPDNDFDYGGYDGGGGKKSKKKYRKKKHKGKKRLKHMAMGVIGVKMLYYHFLMKKMFALSLFSAILSKISILLSSVVALKQLFQPQPEKQQDAKLEVVHIPVHHSKSHDYDYRRAQNEQEQYYQYIPLAEQSPEQLHTTSDRYDSRLRPYRWMFQK